MSNHPPRATYVEGQVWLDELMEVWWGVVTLRRLGFTWTSKAIKLNAADEDAATAELDAMAHNLLA